MIVIETCPICGEDLFNYMIYTNPPARKKECLACGWNRTFEKEEVIRVPFIDNAFKDTSYSLNDYLHPTQNFNNQPCENCPSNPKNGGDGICFCTLGQLNVVY